VVDWRNAGLIKESVLKPVFSTIEQGLVIRVLGHLSATDLQSARAARKCHWVSKGKPGKGGKAQA
jgi:hypothetical protein